MQLLAWRCVGPQYLLCSLLSDARHVHSVFNAWGIGCSSSKCNTSNSLWDVSDFRELSISWCFLLSDVTPRIFIRSLYVFRSGHPYTFFEFRSRHNGPQLINYNDSVEILWNSLFWIAFYFPPPQFFRVPDCFCSYLSSISDFWYGGLLHHLLGRTAWTRSALDQIILRFFYFMKKTKFLLLRC